jgi:hypothetical protein
MSCGAYGPSLDSSAHILLIRSDHYRSSYPFHRLSILYMTIESVAANDYHVPQTCMLTHTSHPEPVRNQIS